jgi:WD40 repeat protein
VWSAAFSLDGSRIVTASLDNTARIWNSTSAKEVAVLRGHDNYVFSAAFSPNGSRIITASGDNTARIWNAASAKEIAVLRGHDNAVMSAAFRPDGSRIVTASLDNTARIWDAASANEIAVLRGHNYSVNSAAFSPDGSRIVTGSADKTARIWDAATAKEVAVLRGHDNAVRDRHMHKRPVIGGWASVRMSLRRRLGLGVQLFAPLGRFQPQKNLQLSIDSIAFYTACHVEGRGFESRRSRHFQSMIYCHRRAPGEQRELIRPH